MAPPAFLIAVGPVLHIIALILGIAATATPGWFLFEYAGYKIEQGFYLARSCFQGICVTATGSDFYNGICDDMRKTGSDCKLFDTLRAMLVVVPILGFLGIGLFVMSFILRGHKANRTWVFGSMAASLVYTLLAFISMCLAVQYKGTGYTKRLENNGVPVAFGGSFVMIVFAWIFGAVATVVVPFTLPLMTA
ncbi:hypothetical protein HDU96_000310 [Phlyctochytrium bullatum]|nr:hypothetical protein HDU96_000310 [Phlyctochytrium bullatum]